MTEILGKSILVRVSARLVSFAAVVWARHVTLSPPPMVVGEGTLPDETCARFELSGVDYMLWFNFNLSIYFFVYILYLDIF